MIAVLIATLVFAAEPSATKKSAPSPKPSVSPVATPTPTTSPPVTSRFDSATKLFTVLESEEAYFIGEGTEAYKWNGELYWYGDKTCYKLSDDGKSVKAQSDPCSENIKAQSNMPYAKIEKIEDFKSKFLGCVERKDIPCLRSMTFRNVKVSFGMEPLGDQAMLMYTKWQDADFAKIKELMQKGFKCDTDNDCTFPEEVEDDGMGQRGALSKRKGQWLLESYLGGD